MAGTKAVDARERTLPAAFSTLAQRLSSLVRGSVGARAAFGGRVLGSQATDRSSSTGFRLMSIET